MTALAPLWVEGWTLYRDDCGDWIKDMDLAHQAELATPRNIRSVIQGCIDDELIFKAPIGARAAGANNRPYFRVEHEVAHSGKGRAQKVPVYYLNREAAVHVIMRLRTSRAVELQIAVVRVFILAVDGRLHAPEPMAVDLGEQLAALRADIAALRAERPAPALDVRELARELSAAVVAGLAPGGKPTRDIVNAGLLKQVELAQAEREAWKDRAAATAERVLEERDAWKGLAVVLAGAFDRQQRDIYAGGRTPYVPETPQIEAAIKVLQKLGQRPPRWCSHPEEDR